VLGLGLTTTVVDIEPVQPLLSVTVNVYGPEAAVVAFVIDGL
jgi:hypothetical protein